MREVIEFALTYLVLLAVFGAASLGCAGKFTPAPATFSTPVTTTRICGCLDCDCCGGCSHCGVKAELLPAPKGN